MSGGTTAAGPRPAATRFLLSALRVGAATALVIVAMLLLFQSRLVFFPTRLLEATPAEAGLPFEDVWLRTTDGVRLHAWWVPAPEARGVVLFFHGNAGNISHRIGSLQTFHRLGYSTLIFDYRGYGQSEGRPSEEGTYRDGEAAWRHLVEERGIDPAAIALFGRSLGGAVAAAVAERHEPGALILESTFTSVPDLGAELYPWLPVRLLARIRYPTLERVARIRAPTLVVHSRGDEIIPFHHGERIRAAAAGPAEFLEITGGHNDGYLRAGPRYEDALGRFLDTHLRPTP